MARIKKSNPVVAALKRVGLVRVILCSLVGLVGAGFAFILAISGITRLGNPPFALTFFPSEGMALGAQADILVTDKPKDPPAQVRSFALAALRNQAINPRALRVLGFYTEVHGDFANAEKLVLMAERLSRRESLAQMWLIEASARRNDTAQTLVHYDAALRVRPDNALVLFPRLASAIEDADIRAALKPYIAAKNGWGELFLADAIAKNADGPSLAALMIDSGGIADREANRELQKSLLGRLVDNGYHQDARRLYLSMDGASAKRLSSTAFDFADRSGGHGPIGWQTIDDVDGGGAFTGQAGQNDITLEIFVSAASTRLVTRKLLFLPSGTYGFVVSLARLDSDPGGHLRWQIRCMQGKSGPLIWTVQGTEKTIRSSFAIPGNCPVQMIELVASGGQGQAGIEATIASVKVMSLR